MQVNGLVTLQAAVDSRDAARRAADSVLTDVLKNWAKEVFEDIGPDEVPNVEMHLFDVEVLVTALREPQTLEHLVEALQPWLENAWRSVHGYGKEMPWRIEIVPHYQGVERGSIVFKSAKVPAS